MSLRTLLSSSALIAMLGLGYGMWALISPGEERRRELVKDYSYLNILKGPEVNVSGAGRYEVVEGFPQIVDSLTFIKQNLPESNPLRMDETRKRNALVMQALKDAAETDENIASRMGRHR